MHIGYTNPLRYRGYYYDTETQLYYLQSRYYNPWLGRFINADDAQVLFAAQGNPLNTNLSVYCCNNAINLVDYEGCWSAGIHYGTKYKDKKSQGYDGTYEWAIECGYCAGNAKLIAQGDYDMDVFYAPFPNDTNKKNFIYNQRYHFDRHLFISNVHTDSREYYGNYIFNVAISVFNNADTKSEYRSALYTLGKALHCYQDIYAHGQVGYWSPILAIHGPFNDYVYYDWSDATMTEVVFKGTLNQRYYDTERRSLSMLRYFISKIGGVNKVKITY